MPSSIRALGTSYEVDLIRGAVTAYWSAMKPRTCRTTRRMKEAGARRGQINLSHAGACHAGRCPDDRPTLPLL
jgi:hypothetical protein